MSDTKLDEYKAAQGTVPQKMLRWHLYGAGLENMGREGQPEEVDVPAFGPEELLVRQDACGLCFSDTKVIGLGANHPRMTGRNLANDPVTLGHEVSCTVVGVGERLKERFQIGDRFVIQADVFYQGKSMAYGYAISGGLAEYSVIPQAIIEGDEGCYLLPIQSETGYVESALTEPWACVVSAYAQAHREGLKPGGRLLLIGDTDSASRDLSGLEGLLKDNKPTSLTVLQAGENNSSLFTHITLLNQTAEWNSTISHAAPENLPLEEYTKEDWAAVRELNGGLFDDIILLGDVGPQIIEGAASLLADHGILNLVTNTSVGRKLSLDIGRIHYNWHYYLGTTSQNPADAYREERTSDLMPGGIACFIGAGGPMGQMHVQRAVQHKNPPRRIVATDVDTVRLQSVVDRYGKTAQERGIELITLNPKTMQAEQFDQELERLSEGRGFDDIVSMVPVAALIEHAANFLAEKGWFNIFAGVARGTMASLDVNPIIAKRARFLGSSGSSLSDMRETLARVESDELSTNASLAAVGGMSAAKEGLQAVKEGWYPGKTLIFPLIHDLPLTPLPELKERLPSVYAKLKEGQFWTAEAEEELLRLYMTPK